MQIKKCNPKDLNSKDIIDRAYTAPMWLLSLLAYSMCWQGRGVVVVQYTNSNTQHDLNL